MPINHLSPIPAAEMSIGWMNFVAKKECNLKGHKECLSTIRVVDLRLIDPQEEWNYIFSGPLAEIRSFPYHAGWGKLI